MFISLSVDAQVVNIEEERTNSDSAGIAGSAQISFQYIKNKSEVFNIGGSLHLQYQNKKSQVLCITDYTLSKSAGADYANAGIQHLRYNYKVNNWLYPEAFTQIQFNKILNVNCRWLIGAGPRFRIIKTDFFKNKTGNLAMYAGTLYMYEYEELINSVYNRDHRLSCYVSLSCKLGKNVSVVNTTYYQPKFKNIGDYRLSSQTDVKILFSKHFYLKLIYIYFVDTYPAQDAPRETQNFKNSLGFEF